MKIDAANPEPQARQFPLLPDLSGRRVLLNGCVAVTAILVFVSWIIAAVGQSSVGVAIEFTVFAVLVIPALTLTVVRSGFGTLTVDDTGFSARRGVKGISQQSYAWNVIASVQTGTESSFWLPGASWLMSLAGTPRDCPFVELHVQRGSRLALWLVRLRLPAGRALRTLQFGTPSPEEVAEEVRRYLAHGVDDSAGG